ncbi:unnamed protein product [Closterium sp. Yama58-4]|nr:unnamed protein product [Closterium sp. Yama58-4]
MHQPGAFVQGKKRGEATGTILQHGTHDEPTANDIRKHISAALWIPRPGESAAAGQDASSRICKVPENKKLLKRDLELLWRPQPLSKLSNRISASMGWDYDAVHVRRGDKVTPSSRKYWPNLDRDTRPKALLETLPRFIKPGRHVYIASNERTPGFFSPLASLYKIHVLSDYRHLWGRGSKFHRDLKALLRTLNLTTVKPELDAYMEWTVELSVLGNAKKRVETFNDLTSDSKNAMIRNNKSQAS